MNTGLVRSSVGLGAVLVAVLLGGCRGAAKKWNERPLGSASSSPIEKMVPSASAGSAEAPHDDAPLRDALASRDAPTRRSAAIAVARSPGAPSAELALRALADEDGQVVAWGAFAASLGSNDREPETVRALAARAATLSMSPVRGLDPGRFVADPTDAIAAALGRCGTTAAEQTLVGWLDGPRARAESAALALGRLALRHRLADSTLVALVENAAKPNPLPGSLAAFDRDGGLSGPLRKRLVDVARESLGAGGERRAFALRALGATGADGADVLAGFISDETAPASDRSLAATVLGRVGSDADRALATAVSNVVKLGGALDSKWVMDHAPILVALLGGLGEPSSANDALVRLASLDVPNDATPSIRRRLVAIRCGAAAVLAGHATQSARLVACDADPKGTAGALAMVRVLDKGALTKSRYARWKELAENGPPLVRMAALAVITRHPELSLVTGTLVKALSATEPGVVAAAARVLYEEPRRAADGSLERAAAREQSKDAPTNSKPGDGETASSPSRAVIDALSRAMDAARPPDQIETQVALARAAAALGVLSLKSRVERYCKSENVTLREKAAAALRALGSTGASCPGPAEHPSKIEVALAAPLLELTFVTDAGRFRLELDPNLAPAAVARIRELARTGFYAGVQVHRVVPGLVAQFGDRGGDGYGGSGLSPLPSEVSPLEFRALSVGIAESGKDTGSSQLFVALAPEPRLYGDYPLVGTADPDWALVFEGDVILRVEIGPS